MTPLHSDECVYSCCCWPCELTLSRAIYIVHWHLVKLRLLTQEQEEEEEKQLLGLPAAAAAHLLVLEEMRHHSTENNYIGATTRSYTLYLSAPPVGLYYILKVQQILRKKIRFFS